MRILVLGAGGIGGYFGGRLLEAGRDVRFLVRAPRAAALARTGLVIESPQGDLTLPDPPVVTAQSVGGGYDLVVLSCKAYDLDSALAAIAPAMGPATAVLPLLNGMSHLAVLEARFGAANVLGGLAQISTTLGPEGQIVHMTPLHALVYGERAGGRSARTDAIEAAFAGANFAARASESILLEMWEKWVTIATLAGITCLMRGTIGDIVAAGGAPIIAALLDEARAIAARAGHAPREAVIARLHGMITAEGSPLTASMLRDIQQGARIEADQIVGELLKRAGDLPSPLLRTVLAHLKTYEARRAREPGSGR